MCNIYSFLLGLLATSPMLFMLYLMWKDDKKSQEQYMKFRGKPETFCAVRPSLK